MVEPLFALGRIINASPNPARILFFFWQRHPAIKEIQNNTTIPPPSVPSFFTRMNRRPETTSDKRETGSVTHWLNELNDGDKRRAQFEIYNRFFARLAALARSRMPMDARREADDHDVALSALDSFFQRVDRGEFPEVTDRTGLWPLLARITAFKASRQVTRERAAKRGGKKVIREADLPSGESEALPSLEQVVGCEPTAEFAAKINEQVQQLMQILPEAVLKDVAQFKLEGYHNHEIAAKLDVGLRTVERKLARIRTLWLEAIAR